MLNELIELERGVREAGLPVILRHPDIKNAGRMSTLVVELDKEGSVSSVFPLPPGITPWTLRSGNHGSFPVDQPKLPIWDLGPEEIESIRNANTSWRDALLAASKTAVTRTFEWPKKSLPGQLRKRRTELAELPEDSIVLATIDRFLRGLEQSDSESESLMLAQIARSLCQALEKTSQSEWIDVAKDLLIGERKNGKVIAKGAFLFSAAGFERPIYDTDRILEVSDALRAYANTQETPQFGVCALTGTQGALISESFPDPNLPVLGKSYLFAKNPDIAACGRYGKYGSEAIPIGMESITNLSAALVSITRKELEGVTWRKISGERPKQIDLLIAYVDPSIEESGKSIVDLLTSEADDLNSIHNESLPHEKAQSIAAFEKRTERVIQAFRGKLQADFTKTPVRVAILRKVDPGNRKIAFSGAPTVWDVKRAADDWAAGEQNTPPWLTIPIFEKGERTPRHLRPPHISPMGLISFSRKIYLRGGLHEEETIGISPQEAFTVFFENGAKVGSPQGHRILQALQLVLRRRGVLSANVAHALRRSFKDFKSDARQEALRTTTVLGLLLKKLGREKEHYMEDAAFKLGQLLAAADAVHVGYCADVRGGETPPSLLGNQVFVMAQTAPAKALSILCGRWKPYEGWVKKTQWNKGSFARIEALGNSAKKEDQFRRSSILRALRCARMVKPLANDLAGALPDLRPDDVFKAELLLGYMAGIPRAESNTDQTDQGEEE